MRKLIIIFTAAAFTFAVAGCSSVKYKEEEYLPSSKLIERKKDTPVYSTWDRWQERNGRQLIIGENQLVEGINLHDVLQEDPDPAVVNSIGKADFWLKSFGYIGMASLLVALYGLGKTNPEDGTHGDPHVGYPAFGFCIVSILTGVAISEHYIEQAQSIHNARINRGPQVTFNWSFK